MLTGAFLHHFLDMAFSYCISFVEGKSDIILQLFPVFDEFLTLAAFKLYSSFFFSSLIIKYLSVLLGFVCLFLSFYYIYAAWVSFSFFHT